MNHLAGVGLNVFYLTLEVPHGFIEFGALLTTFLLAGKMVTGKWSTPFGKDGWVGGWMVPTW